MVAGIGQILGYWDWAEYRLKKEREEDMDRLGKVMGVLRVKNSAEVVKMAKEEIQEISLDTAYGVLVTTRKDGREGFVVSLQKENEKSEVKADLVWAGKSFTGGQEWVDTARKIVVGEQWEYLVSLYP